MKGLIWLLALLALTTVAQAQTLGTRRIATGLRKLGYLAQPPGDDTRLFVLERDLGIRIIKDGVANSDLFLDMTSELGQFNEAATCFAFHPDYQNNGRFFVLYMDRQGFTHLAEYAVSADPEFADPASRIQILGPTQQPGHIHNWDCVKFGPDGMLYVSMGDGVIVADSHINNAQDLSNSFGSILRLNVDIPAPYIPADNPFVGQPGVDEHIWVHGLRQPWRFAFDSLTDDLFIADVGWQTWEEINVLPASQAAGKNFGWRCFEGQECSNYTGTGCLSCGDPAYVPPVYTYPHDGSPERCAIIGGEVYRGTKVPTLQGAYIYADFCSARYWSFKWDGVQITEHVERTAELLPDIGPPVDQPTTFGVDNAGEIYILSGSGGEIYKIVEVCNNTSSYCLANANSAGTTANISSTGTTSICANDFTLTVDGVLPDKVGLFFYGANQVQVPFGEGFRCVGGAIFRLNPPSLADASGSNQRVIDYPNPPQPAGELLAGSTWNFQYWYRDAAAAGLFNLSNGLEASFCP